MQYEPGRSRVPRPRPISEVLSELMARRGYARVNSTTAWRDAWLAAAGEALGQQSRIGGFRRGVLEVIVANSLLVQELSFRKSNLLKSLRQALPDETVRDMRFRVGPLE